MRDPGNPFEDVPNDDIPTAVQQIPIDDRNTAPETRARYRYQDECAALAILTHLGSEDLEGILIEHSTDFILIPKTAVPELVSVKHREPNQNADSNWTLTSLKKDNVLTDLYRAWDAAHRNCTLALWTSAGFSGSALPLWKTCAKKLPPSDSFIRKIAQDLETTKEDAASFLGSLTIPVHPLPRRSEITDVGVRRVADLLLAYRPDGQMFADKVYEQLQQIIARAGTDVPERETSHDRAFGPTLSAIAAGTFDRQLKHRYLPARHIINHLLWIHDQRSSKVLDEAEKNWAPDSHFVGREEHLSKLKDLLAPGNPTEVEPVVIYGMTGCGKTSLATQFAASNAASLRPIFINALSRPSLIYELARLTGDFDGSASRGEIWQAGISENHGPVTPHLPWNSATLLILDGVTTPDTIRGIIPRKALCRVIITSTLSHVDQGFQHIELSGWDSEESRQFIHTALPDITETDCQKLARNLYDHPLAITQAVNYLLATHRSVDEYLNKLEGAPVEVLSLGEASGHLDSITKSIEVNIDLAKTAEPAAIDLLFVLAHLGSTSLALDVLTRGKYLAFVTSPGPVRRGRSSYLRKRILRKGNNKPEFPLTPKGREIHKTLNDAAIRDRAVDALVRLSLIRRIDESITVHPLIALVSRRLAASPIPWLEFSFGLFLTDLSSGGVGSNVIDQNVDHLINVSLTAIDLDLTGPAVVIVLTALTWRLPVLSSGDSKWGGRWTAVEVGLKAVEAAEKGISEGWMSLGYALEARRALAQSLFLTGDYEAALSNLKHAIRILYQANEPDALFLYILDLAFVAASAPDMSHARNALQELDSIPPWIVTSPERVVRIATVRASILRRLGRIEDAKEAIKQGLRAAQTNGGVSPEISESLYSAASLLARNTGESKSVFEYEMAALKASRQVRGEHPDSELVRALLSAADGAIEVGELSTAESIINEAQSLIQHSFHRSDKLQIARLKSTQGRLLLTQHSYAEALTELRESVEIFRSGASFDRSELAAPLVHLAQAAYHENKPKEAMRSIREAYEIDLEQFGPDHPETLMDMVIMRGLATMAMVDGLDETYIDDLPLDHVVKEQLHSMWRHRK